jgi:hypothetical protein
MNFCRGYQVAGRGWAGLLGSTTTAHILCAFRWTAPHWVKIGPWVLVSSRLAVCRAAFAVPLTGHSGPGMGLR